MENEQLIQLLDIHAEGLQEDNDLAIYLIQDWLEDESYLETMALFRLAKGLRNALRPLSAPAQVTAVVYSELNGELETRPLVAIDSHNRWFWFGTIASLLAGLAGLLYWLYGRDNPNMSTDISTAV